MTANIDKYISEGNNITEKTQNHEQIAAMLADLNLGLQAVDDKKVLRAILGCARSYGIAKISKATGLNRAQLYRSLGECGNPAFFSIMKILDLLGLELKVEPKKK